jgi:F-type H+-transporting ATPase subunit b
MRKKAIKDFFSSRTRQTRKRLDELKREKERIEICCQGLEKKIRDLEVEKSEIIEQFRAEGRAEKEKIMKDAKERTRQILAETEVTIQREINVARERVRREVSDAAAQRVGEVLAGDRRRGQSTPDEFIEKVEKLH